MRSTGVKFHIRHTTTYRYRRQVTLQPHRLLMTPRDSHDLRVITRSLRSMPAAELEWTQDLFGNVVATAKFLEAAAALVIEADLTVEQSALAWPIFGIAPGAHSYPFRYADEEVTDLGALLTPDHADPAGDLATWVEGFVHRPATDTLSLLRDINAGIVGRVAYRIRDEEGTQAPLETLAIGSGSCRDIAALFIDAVRLLGFGARAVSGYLYDPDQKNGDAGSTHAWAEVYLPAAGWIVFDPTHARIGSANLVPVAVARHNAQIMPVSGGYLGDPADFIAMDVTVLVEPAGS